MSLAQRRTILDGIDTLPSPIFAEDAVLEDADDEDIDHIDRNSHRRESALSNPASIGIPAEDGKEIWQALSYDAFAAPEQASGWQLQHYESFPPEITDTVAAYEVSHTKRICQVLFAVVACALASGIVCGFAALKPVLIAQGVYRSLCPADWLIASGKESQIPCPAQDMRLNLFFITASIALNVSTVFAGYVLDNHGRRACYLLAAVILSLGGWCMSLAFWMGENGDGSDDDKKGGRRLAGYDFIFQYVDGYMIGNLLLGLGGTFLFVSSYQLSNALPRHAGLVVALVTGAFDASAAVFLFYRLAYEATDHAFQPATFFFSAYAVAIPTLLVVAEFALMPRSGYTTRRGYQAALAAAQQEEETADGDGDENRRRRRRGKMEEEEARIATVTGNAAQRRGDREVARERRATSGVYGILQGQAVAAQMATPWFWLLLLLTVVQMTRMNYFIATVRAQYRYMLGGDEGLAERVNGVFDVALPVAGVVTTPFIGVLLNEVPVWGTLTVLTGLIVVLGVLNCIGTLWAGYATVLAFVLYRPLYYSAVSDYATKVFGFATFGRIYGTVICVSGVGQLVQPALDVLTHGLLHDNPVPVNVLFAVTGSVISAALTLFVYARTRENSARKGEVSDEERRGLLREGREERMGGYGGT